MLYTVHNSIDVIEKVFIDGVDVTGDCFEIDTDDGYVGVFVRNNDGTFFIVNGAPVQAKQYGDIKILFKNKKG